MLAQLKTFSLLGIEAVPVEVEVDVSPASMPKTILVGLPEAAVKESIHRVERAIANSGFVRPSARIVMNLAPAELPKQAASFDLPITLGILSASAQIESSRFEQYAVVGELALDGSTRPTRGALSMAMEAAKQEGLRGLVVPATSAAEAAVVEQVEICGGYREPSYDRGILHSHLYFGSRNQVNRYCSVGIGGCHSAGVRYYKLGVVIGESRLG